MKIDFATLADEGGTSFAPFNDSTLADAETVVRDAFGSGAVYLLKKILRNPVLADAGVDSCGDIVYLRDRPVGFEAAIMRRLYWGNVVLWGVCGSTAGLKKGTSPLALLSVMRRNLTPRGESVLWFANTACAAVVRTSRKLGVENRSPESWSERRYAIIHPFVFLKMIFTRKVLRQTSEMSVRLPAGEETVYRRGKCEVRRMLDVDVALFDAFWSAYLAGNRGLVTSRSSMEVEWAFGERVRSGRGVLLGCFSDGRLLGYLVMTWGADGWWRVLDLIALDNDLRYLALLLKAAKRFLRKRTSAALLFMGGCPPIADGIVRKILPHRRQGGGSPFLWHFTDGKVAKEVGDLMCLKTGWFFGPYDGDACL